MSGLLLDTHVMVWSAISPHLISPIAMNAMVKTGQSLFASAASGYEIELKRAREPTFSLLPRPLRALTEQLQSEWLPITLEDAERAGALSQEHRDPWDRLLAAQAINQGLTLITADDRIHRMAHAWGVDLLW